jgi:hypothetical protein
MAPPRPAEKRFGGVDCRGNSAVWESPCCGVEKLRSERYGMWHNVAIASVLVKHFISDRYEK